MPFKGTSAMDQKTRFIADYLTGFFSHTELCHSYGISRPTGYKWIDRYEAEGIRGPGRSVSVPSPLPSGDAEGDCSSDR